MEVLPGHLLKARWAGTAKGCSPSLMCHFKQTHKQNQNATELQTMGGISCKSFIQWSDFYFALPGVCAFLECGQLKDVYKIFPNTKAKFLYSCHNHSSLNKWVFFFELLEYFMSINESRQLLERNCRLIKWPQGRMKIWDWKFKRIPALIPWSRWSSLILFGRSLLFVSYCLSHR